MNSRIKTSVIVGVVLASLALANFALAQTPPPASDIIPGLNTAGWVRAQSDQAYCLGEFKASIFNFSTEQLKTVWDPAIYPQSLLWSVQKCYVVLASADDNIAANGGIAAGSQYRPYGIISVEEAIKNSPRGISQKGLITDVSNLQNQKTEASLVSQVIGWALNAVFTVVASFLAVLGALAGKLFDTAVQSVLQITAMPEVVNIGWAIVRDICNMFFILVLIVMALATILNVGEEYNYKHLLPKVVLAALLVNFSQIIAVTIINTVNFVAATFYSDGLRHVWGFLYGYINPANDINLIIAQGWQAGLTLGLGKIVFLVIATFVFVVLAAMFVIRLVGLYVLVIFSPVPYIARILPATQKFSEEWWSYFLKYLIWAPVSLFMLRLTMTAVKTMNTIPGGQDSSFAFFIVTAFLFLSFYIAEQAGTVGSKMISE